MSDKLGIGDYTEVIAYLEGVRVNIYSLDINASIDNITTGWIDIPYDDSLLNIQYRNVGRSITGLQPYTRIHIFTRVNNGPFRLLVEGVVTGSSVVNTARKSVRITFMDEMGILAVSPLVLASNVNLLLDIAIQYNNQNEADILSQQIQDADELANSIDKYVKEKLDEKRNALKDLYSSPDNDKADENFYRAYINGNPFLVLFDALLKLEKKVALFDNQAMIAKYSALNEAFHSKNSDGTPTIDDALVDTILDVYLARMSGNMKVWQLYVQMAKYYATRIVPVLNPSYLPNYRTHTVYDKKNKKDISVGTFLHSVMLPDLTWCPPVRGNIFFSDVTGAESLPNYSFLGAPTRVHVSLGVTFGGDNTTKRVLHGMAPKEFRDLFTKKPRTIESSGAGWGKAIDSLQVSPDVIDGIEYFSDSELYSGYNAQNIVLNDWLAQYIQSYSIPVDNTGSTKHIIEYLNAKADYYYMEGYRRMSEQEVTLKRLYTNVVIGLPASIISEKSITVGLVEGVHYTGSPGAFITTVKVTGLHSHDTTMSPRNPLVSNDILSDAHIDNTIYRKYFGTEKINKSGDYTGALEKIQKRYYRLSPERAVYYAKSINDRQTIATFDQVSRFYGYVFNTSKNLLDIRAGIKAVRSGTHKIRIQNDPAFVMQRRNPIAKYKRSYERSRRGK